LSIAGIGLDLVETKRFTTARESLLKRLFNQSEIDYAKKFSKPEIHFSANFAAKEAFLKALGTGLSCGITWKDIELRHKKTGEPFIVFRGKESPVLITISHTETTAGAIVILLEKIDF